MSACQGIHKNASYSLLLWLLLLGCGRTALESEQGVTKLDDMSGNRTSNKCSTQEDTAEDRCFAVAHLINAPHAIKKSAISQ